MKEQAENLLSIPSGHNQNIMHIKSVFCYTSEPKVRLKVQTDHGVETVNIIPCYDSWEQYGASNEVLYFTMPIAQELVSTPYFAYGATRGARKVNALIRLTFKNMFNPQNKES